MSRLRSTLFSRGGALRVRRLWIYTLLTLSAGLESVQAGDLNLNGVSTAFFAASGIPSADIALFISVCLFVALFFYAGLKGITLSIRAVREGSVMTIVIGLLLIACLVVIVGTLF